VLKVDEAGEEDAELVAGLVRLGRNPPRLSELPVLEQSEDGLRIAYINCEKQGYSSSRRGSPIRSARSWAVSLGSSPSPRSSSTVTSLEV
jgi:hypothetical protein